MRERTQSGEEEDDGLGVGDGMCATGFNAENAFGQHQRASSISPSPRGTSAVAPPSGLCHRTLSCLMTCDTTSRLPVSSPRYASSSKPILLQ